jgi:hypothetical protein
MGRLSALSRIGSSLCALVIAADQVTKPKEVSQQHPFVQDYGFLSALTALTQLQLPLSLAAANLTAISACSSLRNLSLSAVGESAIEESSLAQLSEDDCEALGCLVQLTELRLAKVGGTGSSAAFLQALRQLQQLQVLRVDGLGPLTALPALASLPQLQEMGCNWGEEGDDWRQQAALAAAAAGQHKLTVLRSMGAAGHAAIPWAAFPELREVMQWDQWSTHNFAGMCRHCTQLRELGSCEWRADITSLPAEAPAAQRTAAIAALAALPHLTLLHFSANDDAEIAALAAASQLQQLTLMVPDSNLDTKACR